jgi:hypothetical protein
MAVIDLIQDKVKLLPEPTQKEVLDFVDYLLYKSREDREWAELSVRMAVRGLESEEWPDYGGGGPVAGLPAAGDADGAGLRAVALGAQRALPGRELPPT